MVVDESEIPIQSGQFGKSRLDQLLALKNQLPDDALRVLREGNVEAQAVAIMRQHGQKNGFLRPNLKPCKGCSSENGIKQLLEPGQKLEVMYPVIERGKEVLHYGHFTSSDGFVALGKL